MIRESVKNYVFELLDYDIFRFEEFTIREGKFNSRESIKISIDDYYFMFYFERDTCHIQYNPGVILTEEKEEFEAKIFQRNISRIVINWLERVKSEKMNPLQERYINQKIQDFKKELESRLEKVEDTSFTRDEREDLKSRLEILEDIILQNKEQEGVLKEEIIKMQKEIQHLKATIGTSTKRKWLKNAVIKMWSWSLKPENKKLIELTRDTVKSITQIDFPNIVE